MNHDSSQVRFERNYLPGRYADTILDGDVFLSAAAWQVIHGYIYICNIYYFFCTKSHVLSFSLFC